jgi:hypothetical protein
MLRAAVALQGQKAERDLQRFKDLRQAHTNGIPVDIPSSGISTENLR